MFGKPSAGEIERIFNEYGPKRDWNGLRVKLEAMNPTRMKPPEREAWFHARGMVEFQAGDRPRAFSIFEEAVALFPKSGLLLFALGQEYEFQGRPDRMYDRFRRVRLQDVGGGYVLAMCRYLYLWDLIAEAQATLQPIFDAYYKLRCVDDQFLYMRGLPLFGEAFGNRATLALLAGAPELAVKELTRARAKLSGYIFESDGLELDAAIRGKYGAVIAYQENLARAFEQSNFPSGLPRMTIAVLKGRESYRLEEARALVDAVALTDRDRPWLADLRLVYQAELAALSGDPDLERTLLSAFFPRQPLLFEPPIAFSFGLLQYQEKLKILYRGMKGK